MTASLPGNSQKGTDSCPPNPPRRSRPSTASAPLSASAAFSPSSSVSSSSSGRARRPWSSRRSSRSTRSPPDSSTPVSGIFSKTKGGWSRVGHIVLGIAVHHRRHRRLPEPQAGDRVARVCSSASSSESCGSSRASSRCRRSATPRRRAGRSSSRSSASSPASCCCSPRCRARRPLVAAGHRARRPRNHPDRARLHVRQEGPLDRRTRGAPGHPGRSCRVSSFGSGGGQPPFPPVEDGVEPLHAVARLARPGQLVILAREDQQLCIRPLRLSAA